MCFTGELDQMPRLDAEEKAKAAGAKVMANVSVNTGYLVVGSRLDDGRQVKETIKYRKYLALKEKGGKYPALLDEAQLLALLSGALLETRPAVVAAGEPEAVVVAVVAAAAAVAAAGHFWGAFRFPSCLYLNN